MTPHQVFSTYFQVCLLILAKKGEGCLAMVEKESPQALEIGENTALKTLYGVINQVQHYIHIYCEVFVIREISISTE